MGIRLVVRPVGVVECELVAFPCAVRGRCGRHGAVEGRLQHGRSHGHGHHVVGASQAHLVAVHLHRGHVVAEGTFPERKGRD